MSVTVGAGNFFAIIHLLHLLDEDIMIQIKKRLEVVNVSLLHENSRNGASFRGRGHRNSRVDLGAIGYEVGLDCTGRTVQRVMGTMNYHKCVSCRKGWVNKKTAKSRMNWAEILLHKYPESEDWHHVRFNDEVHFGWGSQGKLRIIRQPGTRYC